MLYFFINVLQAIFLGVWSMLWMTIAIVVSFFSAEVPLIMARRCWAPPLLFFAGAKVEVRGLDRLQMDRAYVYVMNHQSMIDVAVALAVIPQNLRFVAKASLLKVPFLGGYIRRVRYVAIDRSQREAAYSKIREASRSVADGRSFLMYPEGTRSNDGTIKKFKRGPFVLAQAARVPVVPVAIDGAGDVLPTGTYRVRPGVIHVDFGAPIATDRYGADAASIDLLRTEVHDALSERFRDLRSERDQNSEAVPVSKLLRTD